MGRVFDALQKAQSEQEEQLKDLQKEYSSSEYLAPEPQARDSKVDPKLVALHDTRSIIAEQLRGARTKLQMGIGKGAIHSVMITSAMQGEGKSTIAANLAIVMADDADKKVLLVDADLRKPNLHRIFDLKNTVGLADALSSDIEFSSVLRDSPLDNLKLMCCGTKPLKPGVLLSSPKMNEFMQWAEENFDWVVLDSPPVVPVTDTVIIARQVEGVVMVIKMNSTQREQIQHAEEALHETKTPLLGIILNYLDYKASKSYYQYY